MFLICKKSLGHYAADMAQTSASEQPDGNLDAIQSIAENDGGAHVPSCSPGPLLVCPDDYAECKKLHIPLQRIDTFSGCNSAGRVAHYSKASTLESHNAV
jgi:hypothetical protein